MSTCESMAEWTARDCTYKYIGKQIEDEAINNTSHATGGLRRYSAGHTYK